MVFIRLISLADLKNPFTLVFELILWLLVPKTYFQNKVLLRMNKQFRVKSSYH